MGSTVGEGFRLTQEVIPVSAPDVTEIFSSPKAIQAAPHFGLTAGQALDLTTGWDLTNPSHQNQAREMLNQSAPKFLLLAAANTRNASAYIPFGLS